MGSGRAGHCKGALIWNSTLREQASTLCTHALASGIRLQEGTPVAIEPIIMNTEKRADLRVIHNDETFCV